MGKKFNRFRLFMERLFRFLFFFAIGAAGYYGIESAVRGYSHWSMALAGGICFVAIMFIALSPFRSFTAPLRALAIAATITGVELTFGFITRELLGQTVWNYSYLPLNFHGYICLYYSLIWFAAAFPAMWFAKVLHHGLVAVMKKT